MTTNLPKEISRNQITLPTKILEAINGIYKEFDIKTNVFDFTKTVYKHLWLYLSIPQEPTLEQEAIAINPNWEKITKDILKKTLWKKPEQEDKIEKIDINKLANEVETVVEIRQDKKEYVISDGVMMLRFWDKINEIIDKLNSLIDKQSK